MYHCRSIAVLIVVFFCIDFNRRQINIYLILSYLILSYLILSYLILSYLILSYLIIKSTSLLYNRIFQTDRPLHELCTYYLFYVCIEWNIIDGSIIDRILNFV